MSATRTVTPEDCKRIARRATRNIGEDFDSYPWELQTRIVHGIMQCMLAMQDEGWTLVHPDAYELPKVAR